MISAADAGSSTLTQGPEGSVILSMKDLHKKKAENPQTQVEFWQNPEVNSPGNSLFIGIRPALCLKARTARLEGHLQQNAPAQTTLFESGWLGFGCAMEVLRGGVGGGRGARVVSFWVGAVFISSGLQAQKNVPG